MIVPVAEAAWRGRQRRRLTLDLYTRYGPFWSAVVTLRERWHVTPTVAVPPEPAFRLDGLGLMTREQMLERFHMPESLPFAPTDVDKLVRVTGEPALADEMKTIDRRLAVRLFLDDVEALWMTHIANDGAKDGDWRGGSNITGWMSWTPFLSACVLYDPPADRLLKFADHDDHEAAALPQRTFSQYPENYRSAWNAFPPDFRRLRDSFIESTSRPMKARRGNPRKQANPLRDVQCALMAQRDMTPREIGAWLDVAELRYVDDYGDERTRPNAIEKAIERGKRELKLRERLRLKES